MRDLLDEIMGMEVVELRAPDRVYAFERSRNGANALCVHSRMPDGHDGSDEEMAIGEDEHCAVDIAATTATATGLGQSNAATTTVAALAAADDTVTTLGQAYATAAQPQPSLAPTPAPAEPAPELPLQQSSPVPVTPALVSVPAGMEGATRRARAAAAAADQPVADTQPAAAATAAPNAPIGHRPLPWTGTARQIRALHEEPHEGQLRRSSVTASPSSASSTSAVVGLPPVNGPRSPIGSGSAEESVPRAYNLWVPGVGEAARRRVEDAEPEATCRRLDMGP